MLTPYSHGWSFMKTSLPVFLGRSYTVETRYMKTGLIKLETIVSSINIAVSNWRSHTERHDWNATVVTRNWAERCPKTSVYLITLSWRNLLWHPEGNVLHNLRSLFWTKWCTQYLLRLLRRRHHHLRNKTFPLSDDVVVIELRTFILLFSKKLLSWNLLQTTDILCERPAKDSIKRDAARWTIPFPRLSQFPEAQQPALEPETSTQHDPVLCGVLQTTRNSLQLRLRLQFSYVQPIAGFGIVAGKPETASRKN